MEAVSRAAPKLEAPKFQTHRLGGHEMFHTDGKELQHSVLHFWQWVASDLRSNANRGRLAEYLVASALGVADHVRREWVAHDVTSKEGIKVEVKSAAYVQGWFQHRPSPISFDIRPTLGWDPDTAEFGAERKRQADVYVFALLHEQDAAKLDPLNVLHWRFFVMATRTLDNSCPKQKTITLGKLLALKHEAVSYGEITGAVSRAMRTSSGLPMDAST